jgi:secondary thiamine-phosphate synthase enzyme
VDFYNGSGKSGRKIARESAPTALKSDARTSAPAAPARFSVSRAALLSIFDSQLAQHRIGDFHNARPATAHRVPPSGPLAASPPSRSSPVSPPPHEFADAEPTSSLTPMWIQREVTLRPRPRGFHLVTGEIESALPELRTVRIGLAHLFIRHTSASLTLNENASPDVRDDFEAYFNDAVPEDARYWTHTIEGPDDMPAHIKASVLGPSLSLPVRDGRLALGTWQGVYLCEHRNRGGARSVVVTLFGEE